MPDSSTDRAPDSGGQGSNLGLVCYFSHPITFGAVPNPGIDRLTPARGNSLGMLILKGEDHLRWNAIAKFCLMNRQSIISKK